MEKDPASSYSKMREPDEIDSFPPPGVSRSNVRLEIHMVSQTGATMRDETSQGKFQQKNIHEVLRMIKLFGRKLEKFRKGV